MLLLLLLKDSLVLVLIEGAVVTLLELGPLSIAGPEAGEEVGTSRHLVWGSLVGLGVCWEAHGWWRASGEDEWNLLEVGNMGGPIYDRALMDRLKT